MLQLLLGRQHFILSLVTASIGSLVAASRLHAGNHPITSTENQLGPEKPQQILQHRILLFSLAATGRITVVGSRSLAASC